VFYCISYIPNAAERLNRKPLAPCKKFPAATNPGQKTRKYIKVLKTALINVKAFVVSDFSTKQIRWKGTMCLGESSVDNSTALEELSVSMYAHYSLIPRSS